ncbi:MAG: hypothetical protein OXF02_05125 [Simkaniaceae bacterium]|nr:hypothetical protein [Simkaniaceae bacterium]
MDYTRPKEKIVLLATLVALIAMAVTGTFFLTRKSYAADGPVEEWFEDRLCDITGYDCDFTPNDGPERKEDTKGFVGDGLVEEMAEEALKRATATFIPGGIDVDFTPGSEEK